MVVEFAVKLPGLNGRTCLLPIDAKFPVEDYQRLLQAADEGDREGVAEARSKLRTRFRNEGKSIAEYINVPETTDFAIMFIPSEGLYAEALALEGLTNELFTSYRVYIMGPSTLASALCAYRAGFQTLAIERRALKSERSCLLCRQSLQSTAKSSTNLSLRLKRWLKPWISSKPRRENESSAGSCFRER